MSRSNIERGPDSVQVLKPVFLRPVYSSHHFLSRLSTVAILRCSPIKIRWALLTNGLTYYCFYRHVVNSPKYFALYIIYNYIYGDIRRVCTQVVIRKNRSPRLNRLGGVFSVASCFQNLQTVRLFIGWVVTKGAEPRQIRCWCGVSRHQVLICMGLVTTRYLHLNKRVQFPTHHAA